MPYVRDDSASPVRRHLSLSPDGDDKAGPSKKPKITTTDIRRKQVRSPHLLSSPADICDLAREALRESREGGNLTDRDSRADSPSPAGDDEECPGV